MKRLLSFALLALLFAGCSKDDENVENNPVVTISLTNDQSEDVNGTTINLLQEETCELTATPSLEGATIVWSSNNREVATVDDGVVTAVSGGTAVITAETDWCSAPPSVTIEVEGYNVTITAPSEAKVTAGSGETLDLAATTNTGETIYWKSSDPETATVGSSDGKVTGVKAGEVTITAYVGTEGQDGYYSDEITIEVAVTIEIDSEDLNLLEDAENATLTATVSSGESVVWSSGNDNYITIDPSTGEYEVIAEGETTITATVGDYSDTINVKISEPNVTITTDLADAKVLADQGTSYITLAASTNTGETIYWVVDEADTDYASVVLETGVVTGLKAGTATLIAYVGTKGEAGYYYDEIEVTIEVTVEIDAEDFGVLVGASDTLTATVSSDEDAVWSSNDACVTIVAETGVYEAVSKGTATITATVGEYKDAITITVADPYITIAEALTIVETEDVEDFEVDTNMTGDFTWTFTPDDVVSESEGTLSPLKAGETTLVISNNGTYSGECVITVVARALTIAEGSTANTYVGSGVTLTASSNLTNQPEINWESSNTGVATVDGGVVSPLAEGTVTITAKADGHTSATCSVKVESEPSEEVALTSLSAESYPLTSNLWYVTSDAEPTTNNFSGLKSALAAIGDSREISLVFPNVTTLPSKAFYFSTDYVSDPNNNLVKVTLPECTDSSTYGFGYCNKLKEIYMPKLEVIRGSMFGISDADALVTNINPVLEYIEIGTDYDMFVR